MGLLSPYWLVWSLAAAVVVALYLSWSRRRNVATSTLSLWDEAFRRRTWWSRWQWTVSLIAAVSIVLLLALALASPIVLSPRRSARNIVLVIDTTVSMSATDVSPTRRDAARQQALQILEELGPYERMAIFTVGSTTDVACGLTEDRDLLRQAMADLPPASGTNSLAPAIRTAQRLLSGKANPRVFVLTDGTDASLATLAQDSNVRFLLPEQTTNKNVAVTQLAARWAPDADQQSQLFVEVVNFSDDSRPLKALVKSDGKTVGDISFTLQAKETAQRVIDVDLGSEITVRIEGGDHMAIDDFATLSLPTQTEGGVDEADLIITGEVVGPEESNLQRQVGLKPAAIESAPARWDGTLWPWLLVFAFVAIIAQWWLVQREVLV